MNYVELIYATEYEVYSSKLVFIEHESIARIIERSQILLYNPKLKIAKVGIYGKTLPLKYIVQAGDRVEIYRPLEIDFMDLRKSRLKNPRAPKSRI